MTSQPLLQPSPAAVIPSMTTTPIASPQQQPSVAETLAIYDHTKRHASSCGKRPMRRTSMSFLPLRHSAAVYFNEDKRLCLAHSESPTGALTVEFFTAVAFSAHLETAMANKTSIVFADRGTFGYASKIIESHAEAARASDYSDFSRAWPFLSDLRQMKLAASMTSRVLPILADVLSNQFWIPTGLEGTRIDEWTAMFGITGSNPAKVQKLIEVASEGETTPTTTRIQKDATTVEFSAMASARYSGLSSQCAQFKKVEDCSGADKALICLDPKLLERNSITGDVCKIHIVSVKEGTFTAQVSAPFKLKPNSDVYLLDPTGNQVVEARLIKLSVGADELLAIFSMPRQTSIVTEAHEDYRSIYATPKPFGGGRGYAGTKWAGSTDKITVIKREVPLDVILAGANTVD